MLKLVEKFCPGCENFSSLTVNDKIIFRGDNFENTKDKITGFKKALKMLRVKHEIDREMHVCNDCEEANFDEDEEIYYDWEREDNCTS